MKVLHVIPGISRRYGGPSTVIASLCSSLQKLRGVDIELATTDADGRGQRIDARALPTEFPIHLFPRTFSEQWKYSQALGRWLEPHVRQFDIVHIHALWSYSTRAAARATRRAGVPYIVRPAGMLSEYALKLGAWKKHLYWLLAERQTVSAAAALHATSSQENSDILRLRKDAVVWVIPNGVDEAGWSQTSCPNSLREKCGEACGELPLILFLGRLHPVKGLTDLLLPAVASMTRPAFLAIVGGSDDRAPGYEREIRETIRKLGISGRVALLGPVPPSDRWAMFDGAQVFVLPSHSENFGIVAAEAMARGCPVVMTDSVQSCEHVAAAGSGHVVSRDVQTMAESLSAIVSQPRLRRFLGDAGRTYANKHFRWDTIAARVEQMYQECLAAA